MAPPEQARQALQEAERRIKWTLQHPNMSPWLKHTLRGAHGRDPIDLLNDLEILCLLLRGRAFAEDEARIAGVRESGH